jgi:hypothetical protein
MRFEFGAVAGRFALVAISAIPIAKPWNGNTPGRALAGSEILIETRND